MTTARPSPSVVSPVEGRAESRLAQGALPTLPAGASYASLAERWAVSLDGPTRESYEVGRARDKRRNASLRAFAKLAPA